MAGRLRQVAVGSKDHVWGVGFDGGQWRWNGRAFEKLPGTQDARSVGVGADGTVWATTILDTIWSYR